MEWPSGIWDKTRDCLGIGGPLAARRHLKEPDLLNIRAATPDDADAIWLSLEPVLRAGATFALPRDWSRDDALAFWCHGDHEVFVAEDEDGVVGTYYLRPNHPGGGAHIATCSYVTAPTSSGKGVGTAMCLHSLAQAGRHGYWAMQFDLVVSSNERAIRLWERLGFGVVGTIPQAFEHPSLGFVDAVVMYRKL